MVSDEPFTNRIFNKIMPDNFGEVSIKKISEINGKKPKKEAET